MAHPGDEGTKEWLVDTIRLLFGEGAHWSADEIQRQAYRSCLRIIRERTKRLMTRSLVLRCCRHRQNRPLRRRQASRLEIRLPPSAS